MKVTPCEFCGSSLCGPTISGKKFVGNKKDANCNAPLRFSSFRVVVYIITSPPCPLTGRAGQAIIWATVFGVAAPDTSSKRS